MRYPQYLVDMFYDYLKAKQDDLYDHVELQNMLYTIEYEVDMYDAANPTDDRDVGWYAELINAVETQYDYKHEW